MITFSDGGACVAACMTTDHGFSASCAACLGSYAACGSTACAAQCFPDDTTVACISCQAACTPSIASCLAPSPSSPSSASSSPSPPQTLLGTPLLPADFLPPNTNQVKAMVAALQGESLSSGCRIVVRHGEVLQDRPFHVELACGLHNSFNMDSTWLNTNASLGDPLLCKDGSFGFKGALVRAYPWLATLPRPGLPSTTPENIIDDPEGCSRLSLLSDPYSGELFRLDELCASRTVNYFREVLDIVWDIPSSANISGSTTVQEICPRTCGYAHLGPCATACHDTPFDIPKEARAVGIQGNPCETAFDMVGRVVVGSSPVIKAVSDICTRMTIRDLSMLMTFYMGWPELSLPPGMSNGTIVMGVCPGRCAVLGQRGCDAPSRPPPAPTPDAAEQSRLLIFMPAGAVALLAIVVVFVIVHRSRKVAAHAAARVLRDSENGEVVRAPSIGTGNFHLFLSHAWATGQDQMRVVKQRLSEIVPGLQIFLDVRLHASKPGLTCSLVGCCPTIACRVYFYLLGCFFTCDVCGCVGRRSA